MDAEPTSNRVMAYARPAFADVDRARSPDAVDAPQAAPSISPPPITPSRSRTGPVAWFRRHRTSFAWFLPVFAVGLVAQIVNLAGSPQRSAAEGTATAHAWALGRLGELGSAPFLFDQTPLGWLQLAGYARITGAFERYDVAVLAGREFMVVTTMVSATLLWILARRLHLGRPAASAALLLFTIAPPALQLHRSVLLENIALMWLLAALVLALSRRRQLAAFAGAAVAFAIAVLSAESFLLMAPLVGWLMWRTAHPETRRRTLSVAAGVLVLIGAGYALLALARGEFAPGSGRGNLLDGLMLWLDSIVDPGRADSLVSPGWLLEPVGVVAAGVAGLGALVMRRLRPFAIAALALIAVLLLPGASASASASAVLLLLPLAALLIPGVVLSAASSLLPRSTDTFPRQAIAVLLVGGTLAAGFLAAPLWATQLRGLVLTDQDQPLRDAENWIDAGLAKDSRLIVDDSMWVDLLRAGVVRDDVIRFPTLDTDPALRALSPTGWRDSDYLVSTASLRALPTRGDGIDQALDNSLVVATFGRGDLRVDIREIHPEGIDQALADAQSATANRASAGAQLAANPNLTLRGDAAELLAGGRVDSRILLALGLLLGDRAATVAAFPAVAGESDTARRQVLVSSDDGAPLADWFGALGLPGAPASVAETSGGVLVTFPFGEPDGLLPGGTP